MHKLLRRYCAGNSGYIPFPSFEASCDPSNFKAVGSSAGVVGALVPMLTAILATIACYTLSIQFYVTVQSHFRYQ